MYKRFRGAGFVAPLIAVVAAFGVTYSYVPIVMGVLVAVVVVLASFPSLGQYQGNRVQYRTTCEPLGQEKYRYLTKTGLNGGDNAVSLLVDRVASLFAIESSKWSLAERSVERDLTPASS